MLCGIQQWGVMHDIVYDITYCIHAIDYVKDAQFELRVFDIMCVVSNAVLDLIFNMIPYLM